MTARPALRPAAGAASVAVVMLVAACGEGEATTASTSSAETSAAPTTAPPAETTTSTAETTPTTIATTTSTSTTSTTEAIVDPEALLAANCAVCHGDEMEGGVGPALASGGHAGDHGIEELIEGITDGTDQMPGWGGVLTAEEIAEIAHFIEELQEH